MIERVLAEFGIERPSETTPLGNHGGFSGSSIWKISHLGESYCLKRWPPTASANRIRWIHKIIVFASANGCEPIVTPLSNRNGETFASISDDFWELCRWSKGNADFQNEPSSAKRESALTTLATFHQATARYQFNFAPSSNLEKIENILSEWMGVIDSIDKNFHGDNIFCTVDDWQRFKSGSPAIASNLLSQSQAYLQTALPVQPVIRDARAEHFFFQNERVVGLIDFGAMQVDTVACDLGRLLGCMTDDENEIQSCLNHYSNIRPLSPIERELVTLFIHSGILIGISNWLNWLFVEPRIFDSNTEVKRRITLLFQRFQSTLLRDFGST